MSVFCSREFSLTVNPSCTDFGKTESQVVAKPDTVLAFAPLNVAYDSTHDVFYSVSGAGGGSNVFCVEPVLFAQLWRLSVGTGGFQGDTLFVPETGFLYYCNRSNGLYEIDVTTHLSTRLLAYPFGVGRGPSYICFRTTDNSLFTCGSFEGGLAKVDAAALTILDSNTATLARARFPLWCPLNDRIYVYCRSDGGTAGLSCVDPDTLAIEATITESQTDFKVPAYSPVSEQIYIVREAFPVFQLIVIDPVFNTVVETINIAPYFPTTTANHTWKCYALGCNVYVISTQTKEYAVFKAKDNSLIANGVWTQIPLAMAAGKDSAEGVVFCANVYPSPYVRITPP